MSSAPKIAYFTVRYPTLSQTFIQREIEGLCRMGLEVHVFPCMQWGESSLGKADKTPSIHPLKWNHFFCGIFWGLKEFILKRSVRENFYRWVQSYQCKNLEDFFRNFWGLLAGLAHADQMQSFHAMHGTWATMPATAAAMAAWRWNKSFSFGAHAYDIYRDGGDGFLLLKIRHAAWIHTTTETNITYLKNLCPEAAGKIVLSRRGLPTLPLFRLRENLSTPLCILSVGRLVPKKGHIYQLDACALLKKRGIPFSLHIVGDGPLRKDLKEKIQTLDLQKKITLEGSLEQAQVVQWYEKADLFLHTGIIDFSGDRDGLPNVIPEAMAHGVAVISSSGGGAGEAIKNGETGWTMDVTQASQLADTIEQVIKNSEQRKQIVQQARRWVEENFMTEKNTALLVNAFQSHLGI